LADEASAAAEEAQSSDEELRSTNEELETAKEELQSANEELSTLNDELRLRNTALVRMNDDIENLLGAVEIPILFVGTDLTVLRFNVTAGLLLNLRPDAIGRPLLDA
jgi:two-component system CheB/CheR fusion protein